MIPRWCVWIATVASRNGHFGEAVEAEGHRPLPTMGFPWFSRSNISLLEGSQPKCVLFSSKIMGMGSKVQIPPSNTRISLLRLGNFQPKWNVTGKTLLEERYITTMKACCWFWVF